MKEVVKCFYGWSVLKGMQWMVTQSGQLCPLCLGGGGESPAEVSPALIPGCFCLHNYVHKGKIQPAVQKDSKHYSPSVVRKLLYMCAFKSAAIIMFYGE